MRAVGREAARRGRRRGARPAPGAGLGVAPPWSAAGSASSAGVGQAELAGARRERAARSSSTARARSAISCGAVRGPARRPTGRAAPAARPGADAGDERVALRERARVGRARLGARRPQRRDDLVEVRAAQRRRALHQLEPVGQEDAHERPRRRRGRRARAARRRPARLLLARREADLERVRAVARPDLGLDARDLLARAHHLALVRRAARARR